MDCKCLWYTQSSCRECADSQKSPATYVWNIGSIGTTHELLGSGLHLRKQAAWSWLTKRNTAKVSENAWLIRFPDQIFSRSDILQCSMLSRIVSIDRSRQDRSNETTVTITTTIDLWKIVFGTRSPHERSPPAFTSCDPMSCCNNL